MAADDSRTRFNLADWLVTRHVREGRGSSVAVLADDVPLTYAAIEALSNQAGQAFRSLGLAPEQRVVLVLHDSPAFYAAFLGAIKIGGIPVPVNTLLRQADYAYLLQDSRAGPGGGERGAAAGSAADRAPGRTPAARHRRRRGAGAAAVLRRADVGPARDARHRRHLCRRAGVLAVQLREHRGAEGRRSTFSAMRWRRSKATRGACWA